MQKRHYPPGNHHASHFLKCPIPGHNHLLTTGTDDPTCWAREANSLCKKATIWQVTTMLVTSKNVLFPGHSHLLTTNTDDLTLWLALEQGEFGKWWDGLHCKPHCTFITTLKVLYFWKVTNYCSLKPLWSGMGEVVSARTPPTLHPPSPPTVHQLSRLALKELT